MPAMYARKRHETLVTSSTDYNTNRALGMGSVEASYWGCMAQKPSVRDLRFHFITSALPANQSFEVHVTSSREPLMLSQLEPSRRTALRMILASWGWRQGDSGISVGWPGDDLGWGWPKTNRRLARTSREPALTRPCHVS